MNRICIEKSTNKLIEFQSGNAPLGTLTRNAITQGYKEENVVESYTELNMDQIVNYYKSDEEKQKDQEFENKRLLREEAMQRNKETLSVIDRIKRLEDILGV